MRVEASKIRYIGARDEQQDSVSLFEIAAAGTSPPLVYAVGVLADGIGGLCHGREAGEVVNLAACEVLRSALEHGPRDGQDLQHLLRRAALGANAALETFRREGDVGQCGATLLIAILCPTALHFLSIGDSQLLALDGSGQLARYNQLHRHESHGRTALTSAVLGEEITEIDQGQVDLQQAGVSAVLLSSDGLETLDRARVGTILRSDGPGKLAQIVKAVEGCGQVNQDNLAMILFELS